VTRKELRINEIIEGLTATEDEDIKGAVAEIFFIEELEKEYPDIEDPEVREMLYETEPGVEAGLPE
jgi:hypothetical protein